MEIGKKIANLRKNKNITQAQLAEYLAVNPQTVSRWEADGGTPDVMLLPKIALFFGVSLDELFGMHDMEQINNLVYKYSVLRDEKSYEEVMRSMELALNSISENLESASPEEKEELQQQRTQLLAWKVHIFIQKSRGALKQAEKELDILRKDVEKDNPLYLALKLQKQQFRIQLGDAVRIIEETKEAWEEQKDFEKLYCYMAALFDAQRSSEILQLWENEDVQALVSPVNEENENVWLMYFENAVMNRDIVNFEKYIEDFEKRASAEGKFGMKWQLLKLYKILGVEDKKEKLKHVLVEEIEQLHFNEYIKAGYLKEIDAM